MTTTKTTSPDDGGRPPDRPYSLTVTRDGFTLTLRPAFWTGDAAATTAAIDAVTTDLRDLLARLATSLRPAG